MSKFFTDARGQFSMSRFWTAVAFSFFTYYMFKNIEHLDMTILLAYVGTLAGTDIAKKYISLNASK